MREEIRYLLSSCNFGRDSQPLSTPAQLSPLGLDMQKHCFHVYARRFESQPWEFQAAFAGDRCAAIFCSFRHGKPDQYPHFSDMKIEHPKGTMDDQDIFSAATGWRK